MNRSIDVRNEVRKLASSKPVHAAAGVGVLASQALRDLPARLAKLRHDETLVSLPARATKYVQTARVRAVSEMHTARSRARSEMHTARSRALTEYDRLARRGQKVMNGQAHAKGALNGKGARSTSTRSANSRSTKAK